MLPLSRADAPETDCSLTLRPPKKKKTSASHLWRLSNPPSKSPLLPDRTACLQKSHSALNLTCDCTSHCRLADFFYSVFAAISVISTFFSQAPHSPAPSSDRRELYKRPQHLLLDHDVPRPSFHFSSPSSGSPQSPQTILPWETPKHKTQHSYMNHTASSLAKSSHSSSMGEGLHTGSPPGSPSYPKGRRSCGELEADPPLLTSSPVSLASFLSSGPLTNSPSPVSSHPTATVSPSRFTQNVPPSRIPLPKQPLSPRRSLCLEVTSGSGLPGCQG